MDRKRTIIYLATALAFGNLAGCKDDSKKDADLFKLDIPVQVPKQALEPSKPSADTNSTAPQDKTATSPIPYIKSSKSTSRDTAIAEYQKNHFYESVVSEVEGFRPNFYHDNIGVATGNGWNVSMQTKTTNTAIVQGIGLSATDSAAIIAISGNKSPSDIPKTAISPEQATKAAQVMRDLNFLPVAQEAVGSNWNKLKPYQQAVVIYHIYKTGNLSKWPTLVRLIRQCASTQSSGDCKKAAEGFTYSYMLNGVRKYDTRSQLYMGALFQDPQAYGYLLGTTAAPADFKEISKASGMKIDPSKPADTQIEAQDDFGRTKERLLEQGKSFDLEVISPDQSPRQQPYSGASLPQGYM